MPNTSDTYVVKKGDTLYGIANLYNLTVDELKRLNNLTTNNLSVGQVLKVKNNIPIDDNNSKNYYIVKSGDSLYKIANQFNTTVNEIKTLNNLNSNLLSIGQKLLIPNNNDGSSSYQVYTVQKGDNLYSIARKYNTTVTALQTLNNLSTSNLSIGQKLLIP